MPWRNTINSQKVAIKDIPSQLLQIELRTTTGNLDDLMAELLD